MSKPYPVRKLMCSTCPYRHGSKYAYLVARLTESALNEASRICHQTGPDNAIHTNTGKPAMICRGSRDVQLGVMTAFGVIEEPTDEAWEKAWQEIEKAKQHERPTTKRNTDSH